MSVMGCGVILQAVPKSCDMTGGERERERDWEICTVVVVNKTK